MGEIREYGKEMSGRCGEQKIFGFGRIKMKKFLEKGILPTVNNRRGKGDGLRWLNQRKR